MVKKKTHSSMNSLFAVLLLMMFAASAFLLILLGSRIYQNGTNKLDENYTIRTAVAYVTEKIRQHEDTGCISMQELDGLPALCLRDMINEDTFYTYIYFYDHSLKELFIRQNTPPSPEMGSTIVELSDFSITESPEGVFTVTAVTDDGVSLSELIFPVVQP